MSDRKIQFGGLASSDPYDALPPCPWCPRGAAPPRCGSAEAGNGMVEQFRCACGATAVRTYCGPPGALAWVRGPEAAAWASLNRWLRAVQQYRRATTRWDDGAESRWVLVAGTATLAAPDDLAVRGYLYLDGWQEVVE